MKVIYVGYTKENQLKTLQKILSFCASNSIIPDNVEIENQDKPDFPVLIALQKKQPETLIIYEKGDLGPTSNIANIAHQSFKHVVEASKYNHNLENLFKLYDKAQDIIKKFNKNIRLSENLLGYRIDNQALESKIVIKESEVKPVVAIFNLRIKQGRNLEHIKGFCDRYNIKKPDNSNITVKYLNKLFEHLNCYVGYDKLPSGQLIKNLYPPLLTEKEHIDYYVNIDKNNPEWLQPQRQWKNRLEKIEL